MADLTTSSAVDTFMQAVTAAAARASIGALAAGDALGTPASGNLANCTFPTLNQNTTGSAATLTTPRTLNGVSFNGSANITVPSDIAPGTSGNVLTSNGTVWTSAAPTGGGNVTTSGTQTFTGTNTFNLSPVIPVTDLGTDFAGGVALTLNTHYRATLATNHTLTFSGTPAEGSTTSVRIICTTAATLTIPSCKRMGDVNSAITSIAIPTGVHELRWRYVGAEYVMYDTVSTVTASNTVSALDVDWSLSSTHKKTLAANSTFTFSNSSDGQTIIVALTNTASNFTVTWPTVSWSGGTAPTQTVGTKTDIYTFVKLGTTIYGSVVQNF